MEYVYNMGELVWNLYEQLLAKPLIVLYGKCIESAYNVRGICLEPMQSMSGKDMHESINICVGRGICMDYAWKMRMSLYMCVYIYIYMRELLGGVQLH